MEGVLSNVRRLSPVAWFAFDGALRSYITAAQDWKTTRPADAAAALRESRRTLAGIRAFSKLYPITWTRYYYHLGRFEMCRGKVHEAQAAWQLSLRWAERINLPVDSALARLELARSAPEDTLERQNHVQLALACFRESKVPRLIEEAESLA